MFHSLIVTLLKNCLSLLFEAIFSTHMLTAIEGNETTNGDNYIC
jgi:hypothetical protein